MRNVQFAFSQGGFGMAGLTGIFDDIYVKQLFQKNERGETVFYPFGLIGRGYLLPKEREADVRQATVPACRGSGVGGGARCGRRMVGAGGRRARRGRIGRPSSLASSSYCLLSQGPRSASPMGWICTDRRRILSSARRLCDVGRIARPDRAAEDGPGACERHFGFSDFRLMM